MWYFNKRQKALSFLNLLLYIKYFWVKTFVAPENNHRSCFSLASHVSFGIPCNTQIDENTYEWLKILIDK